MRALILACLGCAMVGCGGERDSSSRLHVQGSVLHPEFASYQRFQNNSWINHGLMVIFYEQGGVETIQNVENNVLNGPAWTFFPDGQPATAGQYSDGKPSGVWRIWSKDGKFHDKNVSERSEPTLP